MEALQLLIIATTLLVPVSLALLVFGWRGRRIDDHPWCRRCRYDLQGVAGTVESCPECGRSLKRRRAVRQGRRRKRRGMLAVGLLAVLLAGTGGGFIGWEASQGFDWQTIKPVWWLRLEAKHGNPTTTEPAMVELLARLNRNTLSPGQIDALVRDGLGVQADGGRPWDPRWGTIIEHARVSGRVDQDAWLRYLDQGLRIELDARDRLVVGDPVLRRLLVTDRLAEASLLSIQGRDLGCTIDGHEVLTSVRGWSHTAAGSRRRPTAVNLTPRKVYTRFPYHPTVSFENAHTDLAPGEHELRCSTFVDLYERRPGSRAPTEGEHEPDRIVVQEHLATRTITIEPKGTRIVTWATDPGIDEAVTQAITVRRVTVQPRVRGDSLIIDLRVVDAPVDLAFAVFLEADGERWRLGRLAVDAATQDSWGKRNHSIRTRVQNMGARSCDIVLEPDHRVAVTEFDVDTPYGGTVRIADVPIDWGS